MHVLLVDDHPMFRQGLKFLLTDLDESLQFTEAGSCDQALDMLRKQSVNLILLDLNMPGTKGIGALQAVIKAAPTTPLAVLSGEDQPALIREAIEAGASGFVPKSSTSQALVGALQLILTGGIYLPENALGEVAGEVPVSNSSNTNHADHGSRLSAVYRVLGVNNRTEAVYAAAKLGLRPPLLDIG